MQLSLFGCHDIVKDKRPRGQLLKWIGNKQRMAHEIVSYFPTSFHRYFEPFLGSGAVLATLAPPNALGSDIFKPLVEIWQTLVRNPEELKYWYESRWNRLLTEDKITVYESIKAAYNCSPNGADLLFLSRACYGGVVRFRQSDGFMSTPCGIHNPIPPQAFSQRTDEWYHRVKDHTFSLMDFREALKQAGRGDLIYCDPPYHHSQSILYGAQSFDIQDLFEEIRKCKNRGAYVALSLDGTKKSGDLLCHIDAPQNLFEQEVFINCGRSMLRRFQLNGKTLEREVVADRLLLTYR